MNEKKRKHLWKFKPDAIFPLTLLLIIAIIITFVFSLIFHRIFSLGEYEITDQLFHLRYKLFGKEKVSPYLIHIVFDDATLHEYGGALKDRELYGRIIEILSEAGVRSIAFDIFFQHAAGNKTDDELSHAASGAGNVYFPVILYKELLKEDWGPAQTDEKKERLYGSIWHPRVTGKGTPLEAGIVFTPFDELGRAAKGFGHINCTPDMDGINRRFPLLYKCSEGYIPALTLKMVCDYLEVKPGEIEVAFDRHLKLKKSVMPGRRVRDISIPIDKRGRLLINYPAPWKDSFYVISAKDLLAAYEDEMLKVQLKDTLENSLVLVSDTSIRNKDVGPGIFDSLIPYSEILITIANMVLTGRFIQPIHPLLFSSFTACFITLLWLSFFWENLLVRYISYIGCYGVFIAGNIMLFIAGNTVPVLLCPTAGFVLFIFFISIYQYGYEKRKVFLYRKKAEDEGILKEEYRHEAEKERGEKREIEERERIKTSAIDNIVHDFRNYLQGVTASLHTILNFIKKGKEHEIREDVIEAEIYTGKLFELTNDILDIAKIQAGMVRIKAEKTDLAGLCKECLLDNKVQAEKKNICIHCEYGREPLWIMCEKKRLQKAVNNLLSNAIKFTHEGGSVILSISLPVQFEKSAYPWDSDKPVPEKVIAISVKDTGCGIKKEEQGKIFDRFYSKSIKGTGIGLAVVKEYIALLYGHVKVESEAGKGSVFTIYLPFGDKHLDLDEIADRTDTSQRTHEYEYTDIKKKNKKESPEKIKKSITSLAVYETLEGDIERVGHNLYEKRRHPHIPLLIVDDEESVLKGYKKILNELGYNFFLLCRDGRQVRTVVERENVSAIILDLMMPHISGLNLVEMMSNSFPRIPVIIVSGTRDIKTAVDAIKKGAFDYLVKPIDAVRLKQIIEHALEKRRLENMLFFLSGDEKKRYLKYSDSFTNIITQNDRFIGILKKIEKAAEAGAHILITGESGVGKELIAHAVHMISRRNGKFVDINVTSITKELFASEIFGHVRGAYTGAEKEREGRISLAHKGTLFLDEIGELNQESQVMLLRFLEQGKYSKVGSDDIQHPDVRIIAATNKDLQEAMKEKRFRNDLYYRFTFKFHIPPLRERKDDIPLLIHHFIENYSIKLEKNQCEISPELLALLSSYDFPGNIRELQTLTYNAFVQSETDKQFYDYFKEQIGDNLHTNSTAVYEQPGAEKFITYSGEIPTLDELEKCFIYEALQKYKNKTVSAKILGIDVSTLYRKMKKYNIKPPPG